MSKKLVNVKSEPKEEKEFIYYPNRNLPNDPEINYRVQENDEAEFDFSDFMDRRSEKGETSNELESSTESVDTVKSKDSLEYLMSHENLESFSATTLILAEKLIKSKFRFFNKVELIEELNRKSAEKNRVDKHIELLEARIQLLIEARKKRAEIEEDLKEISESIFLVDRENVAEMDLMILLQKLRINEEKLEEKLKNK
ncbi:hypothetical protein V9T40_005872 [Parthenolecanium corni]|uniref:Uncharacterized protein n=1 Tax=Parthenolecanium corni TaxID=536013 RepID=A0AAN9YA05_9HEMI